MVRNRSKGEEAVRVLLPASWRKVSSRSYSIAFTMSSTTFFASPKTIMVLSM